MSETLAYAALAKQHEKLERENANLLKLLHDHQNHWNTIGWAFGLCMGGVDGDVTDLHGNAALIIEHCVNIAVRTKKETAETCIKLLNDEMETGGCTSARLALQGLSGRIEKEFGLEI